MNSILECKDEFLRTVELELKREIYHFDVLKDDKVILSIDAASDVAKPYLISKNVETHPFCAEVHTLFRKIYGKMAGNYATLFLPTGGIYIAGGVISKDERHFLSDDVFMNAFYINHKENISQLLKRIPVYIVRDYSTSLLGAANKGYNLIK